MSRFVLKLVQLLAILAVVRGSVHIIRLIILATLGLGGLVLYQAVTSGKPISHIQSAIGKRSISNWSELQHLTPSIHLAFELDDRECARQYICELAATQRRLTSIFPDHISVRGAKDEIALEKFKDAARLGLRLRQPAKCHQAFQKCPYQNIDQMQSIIEKYKDV